MSKETGFRDIDRKSRTYLQPIKYIKRDKEARILDFEEVILGYSDVSAREEASRCVQCPEPQACLSSCPAGNDVPEAIWHISQGEYLEAAKVFMQTSPLPEICGRVCPNLCQQGCVLSKCSGSVSVGKLEAFVSDIAREHGLMKIDVPAEKTGLKIAVVGSGPAGLTVAEAMIRRGHAVTVYEAWPEPGGVLLYGIPNFKLDKKKVVGQKVKDLQEAGVEFITNTQIGRDIPFNAVLSQYDAIFLGTGASIESSMSIPGEDLDGVVHSTDFLTRANVPPEYLPKDRNQKPTIGRRVAVIGGGDTAVDCARSSIRLGAESVRIVYRRTEAEMPGNKTERGIAIEEGVKINYLLAPVEFLADENGQLKSMRLVKMELGEPDSSGRRRPVPIKDSEYIEEVDTVILAIGYKADPRIKDASPDLSIQRSGLIIVDYNTGATSIPGVFAGGDNVNGPDLVVTAILGAKKAIVGIDAWLAHKKAASALNPASELERKE
jgi:glutamate synthase (NADPH) small chain